MGLSKYGGRTKIVGLTNFMGTHRSTIQLYNIYNYIQFGLYILCLYHVVSHFQTHPWWLMDFESVNGFNTSHIKPVYLVQNACLSYLRGIHILPSIYLPVVVCGARPKPWNCAYAN